ncbi:hypothetical protein Poly51_04200 [Rubripirellula tenax]|uniref:Secreted protein n=1 Tax=Rubripirellula tenax TaxID=2528015 RepID=A0A5C6FEA5_9BACT|nr:hypothetical protein [Rubripirellula tenax]TWU60146.1 hypothetical protein Poly51_04200 [Rubripirellula tenax]
MTKLFLRFNAVSFAMATILGMSCILPLTGCGGSEELSAVTDDADAKAIADYERMIQEDEEAADASEGE